MLTYTAPRPVHHDIIEHAASLQPSTKEKYIREIDRLISAGIDPRDRAALTVYVASLSSSSRAFLKASLNLLFSEQVTNLKASANGQNIDSVQAALLNIEAMTETIHVQKVDGSKTHTWLSREQIEQITSLPDTSTIRGKRDYIVLAMLLGSGLRRDELSNITCAALKQQPARSGMRDVLSVTGKGNKRRTIPISAKLAHHLREWHKIAGDGYIVRAINKAGKVNGSLSPIGIHNIVRQYGAMIGKSDLDSHDLRRTYAMIGYMSGVPITQISVLLGHADVKTTMRYLNLEIDLDSSISDFIPLAGD